MNAVALAVLGGRCFSDYVTQVLPTLDRFRDYWPNASLVGFWCKLFEARSGHVIPLWQNPPLAKMGILLSCTLVCGLCGWKIWRARERSQQDLAFAICVLGMLLVSPITWDHYFLLLLLPIAIFWSQQDGNGRKRWGLLVAALLLAWLSPKRISDLTIPGPGELPLSPDVTPSVAAPWQVLTVGVLPVLHAAWPVPRRFDGRPVSAPWLQQRGVRKGRLTVRGGRRFSRGSGASRPIWQTEVNPLRHADPGRDGGNSDDSGRSADSAGVAAAASSCSDFHFV